MRVFGTTKTNCVLLASLMNGAALFVAPSVFAQSEDATRADEIVVTARRREEALQNVPIAVSAFNADRVSTLQAATIAGLQYAAPNVYIDQGDAANAVIFVRGVGQNDSLAFADPGVGVYVDDVFIARSQAAFLELFDVERVEVLRGPQGTLYGRNTIGGAIKFVSTRPSDKLDAYMEAGFGNFSSASVRGRISGPIMPGILGGKIAFSYAKRDGYSINTVDSLGDGDFNSFAGRGSLLWTPSDNLEFTVSVDGRVDRPRTSRSPIRETAITGAPTLTTLTTFPAASDPRIVDVNANRLSDQTAWGASVKGRWEAAEGVALESITAYRTMDFDLDLDTDGSPLPILDILLLQNQRQFSQELRATVERGRLAATGGVYYFHDDDKTFSGYDDGAATVFGFPVAAFGFPTSALAQTDQVTNSYAAFFDASFKLASAFDVSAGLRYTRETRRSARVFENFFNPATSVIRATPPFLKGVGVAGVPISGEATFDALTPRFSVSWKPQTALLAYASASRGFKSGGFDGRASTQFQFQPFRPEFVWSYEGGLKSSWFDGRLVANAAYFWNDYTDVQVTSFGADPATGAFVSLFTNAARARTQGAELELTAKPHPRLDLTGSVGWLDAQYKKFDILVGGVATDVSDRALVNAPRWNASLGATYTHPVSDRIAGILHVDGAYRGRTATEITASPVLTQGRYGLLNAFAALKSRDDRWELRAGVKNATNEAIRVQGFNLSEFPGVQLGFYGAPRTWDFSVILRY